MHFDVEKRQMSAFYPKGTLEAKFKLNDNVTGPITKESQVNEKTVFSE